MGKKDRLEYSLEQRLNRESADRIERENRVFQEQLQQKEIEARNRVDISLEKYDKLVKEIDELRSENSYLSGFLNKILGAIPTLKDRFYVEECIKRGQIFDLYSKISQIMPTNPLDFPRNAITIRFEIRPMEELL